MKTKTILILALAACFAFAGCSEDNGDSFKPAETVPASQTTTTSETTSASESSESQTETTTETTTESTTTTTEPTTTTEAETTTKKKTTTTTAKMANSLKAPETAFANGSIIISGEAYPDEGKVVIILQNNSNNEVSPHMDQKIITTDNKTVTLSGSVGNNQPADPGTHSESVYSVDSQYLKPGFKFSGQLRGASADNYVIVFK